MLLKARRIAAGLTPAQIAEKLGTGERLVWRCEATGKLPVNALVRAKLLRLLSITEESFPVTWKKKP